MYLWMNQPLSKGLFCATVTKYKSIYTEYSVQDALQAS